MTTQDTLPPPSLKNPKGSFFKFIFYTVCVVLLVFLASVVWLKPTVLASYQNAAPAFVRASEWQDNQKTVADLAAKVLHLEQQVNQQAEALALQKQVNQEALARQERQGGLSKAALETLYQQIMALEEQVNALPLRLVLAEKSESKTLPLEATKKEEDHGFWKAFRQWVVIYHRSSTQLPPFVHPDEGPYIYQNVRAILNQTVWALLHQDPVIYQASLKQAEAWLRQYFLTDSKETQAALASVQQLATVSMPAVRTEETGERSAK